MTGSSERPSRTAALAERLNTIRARGEQLPGASVAREVWENERELGGGLIAGGLAFRIFLWLVPFGLVAAAVGAFWSEQDPNGIESAARRFGIGAAAAQAASEALQIGDRSALVVLLFGLVLLAWFTISAVRALLLAHALAWQLRPPRIRRPHYVILVFNGLVLLALLSSVGEAWLEAQIGYAALLGVAVTLTVSTAIALYAMWLLPHRYGSARAAPRCPARRGRPAGPPDRGDPLLRPKARPGRGDVRRLRHGGDDPRLALRHRPPCHRRRLSQRNALEPPPACARITVHFPVAPFVLVVTVLDERRKR